MVRLKAGGPPMVVRAVSGDTAYCQWYAGVDLHQGTFLFGSLDDISRHRRSPVGNLSAKAPEPDLHGLAALSPPRSAAP